MEALRINDITLTVKGSKIQESVAYISNSLFGRGFDKFTLDVSKDEDDNPRLTVDVWKDVSEEELRTLVDTMSRGVRNKFIGTVKLSYTVHFSDYCKCPIQTITGSNDEEVLNEIHSVLYNP